MSPRTLSHSRRTPTTGEDPTARFRQAFADSVNLTQINLQVNNNLGKVANGLEPPGIPPQGSYNASLKPAYSYNPHEVQSLLLSAMQNPITQFRFENGSAAPPGVLDRKSTRLNSSHSQISYAVFCLKKKKQRRRHALQ